MKRKTTEKTDVYYNPYNVINTVIEFIDKANAMQTEFINIAAHELRTPTQPILGLSQVLLSEKKEDRKYSEELLHVIIETQKDCSNS
jgi:signal transduction histidine kinase